MVRDLIRVRARTLARSTRDVADILGLGVVAKTDRGQALVVGISAAVAQWERRILALSRTRDGWRRSATTSKHMGRPSTIPEDAEDRIYDLARPTAAKGCRRLRSLS